MTIPDGQSSVLLTVTPVQDSAVEGTETVVVSIVAGAGYTLDASAANTQTLNSDDNEFTVTSSADSGAGSLREAIQAANLAGGGLITIPTARTIYARGNAAHD